MVQYKHMVRARSFDKLFTSGSFLNPASDVVDVVIYTGQRPSRPGGTVGHFIIEVIRDEADAAIHEEVAFGSDQVRHPSINNGVREAWSIIANDVEVHFGSSSAATADAHITSLVIDGTVHNPVPDGFRGATL